MRAITYHRYGPPEVLAVEEVARPVPKDDEVLVRVRAAEVTKSDCELRRFRFPAAWFWLPLRLAWGVRRPRRTILGGYGAGVVVEVGTQVGRFDVGDQVFGSFGLRMGAYGEFAALPERSTLALKPRSMGFAEAAAAPLGGLNALHFLRLTGLRSGERLLVNGAGGSIGTHAVQIAKAWGAEVTAVDAGRKRAALERLGADRFIDYTKENFATRDERYDVVLDMVPGSSYDACLSVLEPGGRYATGNPRVARMLRCLFTSWFTGRRAHFAFARETLEELEALRELVDAKSLGSIVDTVLPIERAVDAHRRVEAEQRDGAIVLEFPVDA